MKTGYQYVVALHGDELQPFFALEELGCEAIFGNPLAASRGKRFIDKDLNSCFGSKGDLYEEKRAARLLEMIAEDARVVDFHTFSCTSVPFCVVVDPSQIELAMKTGIPKIVMMTHNIKAGQALINHRSGVSVEVGHHHSHESFETTLNVIRALSSDIQPRKPEIYEAVGIIEQPGDYLSFTPASEGFVPVLAGEVAYKHYGIKAVKYNP